MKHLLAVESIDAYVIMPGDFHGSEYISEYFQCLQYITGFTGSAGAAVITQSDALLWVDGRYFLQAEQQLEGSDIQLMRDGEKGVPSIYEYIESFLKKGMCIAFDGRVMSAEQGIRFEEISEKCGAVLRPDFDAVTPIWDERPKLRFGKILKYGEEFAGKSTKVKMLELRERLASSQGDVLLISALDDVAWLLNLRGSDIPYNPVFFAHVIITGLQLKIYAPAVQMKKLQRMCPYAEVRDYEEFYEILTSLDGMKVLLDPGKLNYFAFRSIPQRSEICRISNSSFIPKHIKNDTEIENITIAHLKDGIAVTRFIYKLKKRIKNGENITEIDAANMLEELRCAQAGYVGPSFAPIIAYKEHGAVIHYNFENAQEGEDATLIGQKSFLLADTGGQYLQGTTDVTRTVAMGALSEDQKRHYTAVLKGNINLAATIFPKGITGANLDSIARRPVWQLGLNYNHGTGHGVGCFLNVHEGPISISNKMTAGKSLPFEKGMVISNEPGIYMNGQYGIRLENLMLCAESPDKPGFMRFEVLTLVPFEREAILMKEMNEEEKAALNKYHTTVRDALMPYMDEEEAIWLNDATKPI
ncbi:MAG: aminopeptidase P family protein [Eubacteriales bacterium]|nr:aminopeptidase P family protein [Eubacteriales bacterium]